MKIKDIKAHCDIPCAVYDPYIAQFAALSLIRIVDLINESPDEVSIELLQKGKKLHPKDPWKNMKNVGIW